MEKKTLEPNPKSITEIKINKVKRGKYYVYVHEENVIGLMGDLVNRTFAKPFTNLKEAKKYCKSLEFSY